MVWSIPAGDYFAYNPQCSDTFFVAWAEQPADREHGSKNITLIYLDSAIIRCTSSEKIVRSTATVDSKGNVLNVQDVVPIDLPEELNGYYPRGPSELVRSFISSTTQGTYEAYDLQLQPLGWFNYHLTTLYPQVIRDSTTNPQTITVLITALQQRVSVSTTMIIISIVIAVYATAIILLIYWGPRPPDPAAHAPENLAAMWSLLYASDAKEVCRRVRGDTPQVRMEELKKSGTRYGYGVFKGRDGRKHIGVFMSPGDGRKEGLVL